MPLSEHEQRLLDQIERALYQEDPKFASTVRHTDLRTHMKRRLVKAALVFVVGFAMLLAGAVIPQWAVGIAGFAVMFLALLLAMQAWKRMGQAGPVARKDGVVRKVARAKPRPSGTSTARVGGGIVGRLEQRWKRRWEDRGGGQ